MDVRNNMEKLKGAEKLKDHLSSHTLLYWVSSIEWELIIILLIIHEKWSIFAAEDFEEMFGRNQIQQNVARNK